VARVGTRKEVIDYSNDSQSLQVVEGIFDIVEYIMYGLIYIVGVWFGLHMIRIQLLQVAATQCTPYNPQEYQLVSFIVISGELTWAVYELIKVMKCKSTITAPPDQAIAAGDASTAIRRVYQLISRKPDLALDGSIPLMQGGYYWGVNC
jgi:hypothetical protein